MPLTKRAIIYDRVSEDRSGGRSVQEQEAENRKVVERYGWQLVAVFTDNAIGASRYSKGIRTAWHNVVQALERGEADVLVTWEASRSTRDLEAYVALRKLCRRLGVLWCYNGKLHDLSDSTDAFTTGLDILLAEKEVDQSRERILRAVRANAAAGKPHGKRPFGYEREYDSKTGVLLRQVIRESEAALIREAAQRIASGEVPYRVVNDWNARGIKSPRGAKWGVSVLKRVITNPIYIGKRHHKGQITEGTWEPILDEATFYKLQAMYGDPDRRKFADPKIKYLLTGIAKCGVCGGRILVRKPKGYPCYTCVEAFCIARKIESVDELVTKLVIARLSQPDALRAFEVDEDDGVSEKLELLADTRARLNAAVDAAAEGKLTIQSLGRIESRLLGEIEALERAVRRVGVPSVVYDLATAPEAIWPTLDIVAKRLIVKTLLDIRILTTGRGRQKFDPNSVEIRWLGEEQP